MKKLKDKVLEIVKIAEECPENLQPICFEILLKHHLAGEVKTSESAIQKPVEQVKAKPEPKSVVEESAKSQDDLADSDLDVKARKFLKDHDLTVNALNQLYYKENNEVIPLYDDLKTTKASESQVRITLLQCLRSAINTGEFTARVVDARREAKTRKCFDTGNWAANYTNNAILFDFDKYSKKVTVIKLSKKGKAELAKLIREMQ